MTKKTDYKIVKETIPVEIEQNSVLNISTNNVTPFTHGFHKYPGKFIPQLPKWAIEKYLDSKQQKTILDPFCGSGTTLVEANLAGHNSIGIDIDPLSALISKVKTTPIDEKKLQKISNWLVDELKVRKEGAFIPECVTIDHWFTKDAIKKLSILRTLIDEISTEFGRAKKTSDIKDLLTICFSSIIRRVSNADNQSQKTYVSHTKPKVPEEVCKLFQKKLQLFVERAVEFSKYCNKNIASKVVLSSSATSLQKQIDKQQIDLAVTSPPYIKAIDYIYNQMVELFWIGDLFEMQTQTKQNIKKKNYIGNKQIPKAEFNDYNPYTTSIGINAIDKALQKIFDTDDKNGHKHAYITFKYFNEMRLHFREMYKACKADTPYVMVVGNSSVSNIIIKTDEFLTKIAEKEGFKLVNKWGYKIKNRFMRFNRKGRGGIIEIDWVLEFIRI